MSSDLKSRSLLNSRTLPLALVALGVFFLAATSASPNPTPGKPRKPGSSRIPNRYIVVLRQSVRDPGSAAAKQARRYGAKVTHVYRSAVKGYAAKIPSVRLSAVRANPNVRFVYPDLRCESPTRRAAPGSSGSKR